MVGCKEYVNVDGLLFLNFFVEVIDFGILKIIGVGIFEDIVKVL